MDLRRFRFKLLNSRTNEIKEFVCRNRSMNEAISDAYIKVHNLRKHPKDGWKIISASDTSYEM